MPCLPRTRLQIVDQLALDPVLRARVDLMHEPDQQIDERVGDLRRARPAQRRQQRQPDRLGSRPQSDGYSFAAARAPRRRPASRSSRRTGRPAARARGPARASRSRTAASPARGGRDRPSARPAARTRHRRVRHRPARRRPDASSRATAPPTVGTCPRRTRSSRGSRAPRIRSSATPGGSMRSLATAPQQRVAQTILAELDGAHLARNHAVSAPRRRRCLAKPERLADLRAVILDRPPRPA